MIPDASRQQVANELVALGGTPDQVMRIGEIAFMTCALDTSRDAEYLLEQMTDDDPLIKRACKIMLDALI